MRNIILLFLLGMMALLLLGCVNTSGRTQIGTKQAEQEQTGALTGQQTAGQQIAGQQICIIERPSMKAVEKYYDDGAEKMRIENTIEGKTLITVIKDGYALSQVSEDSPLKDRYADCDWVAMEVNIESIRGGIKTTTELYKKEVGFKFTCTPWVVNQKMFETPGKVCLAGRST